MSAALLPNDTPILRRRLHEEVERRLEDEIVSERLQTSDAVPSDA